MTYKDEKREVFCSRCKKSCTKETGVIDNQFREDNGTKYYCNEYAEISAVWGYWSKKDCQTHSAALCEDCYDEFINWIGPQNINVTEYM